ncbi:MAG: hypothetical protein H6659_10910 [Ardenticatenaceae bacterium]|nr:hypothetical protein [Ardenticatenaceae bacterium]
MDSGTKNQLVSELAKTVVPMVAPYEVELFAAQKEEYLQNPEKVIRRHMGPTAVSSSHPENSLVFLAPVVYEIFEEALEFIAQEFGPRPFFEGGISRLIAISLTPQQITQIRQMAYQRALESKLSLLKARLVSDAVVNKLVMTHPLI